MDRVKLLTISSLLALCLVPATLAVPEVEAVPIAGGCSAYPDYDSSSNIAGPWVVQLVETGNSSVEGYYDTDNTVRNSDGSLRFGYITFPSDNRVAKNAIRCSSTSSPSLETLEESGNWLKLQVSPYPYDASMVFAGPGETINGSSVLPFHHYDTNGNKIDGVFLGGYANSTTWGITYEPKGTGDYGQDFYYVRLLGPDAGDLQEGEFTGFIKVNA